MSEDYGDTDNPHTFEQGLAHLAQGNWIDYEVKIDGHQGALMTRETWLESVADHSFVDYDGMGNEVSADGKILLTESSDYKWLKPSNAAAIRPETKFILWYNR
jgi:hypothetical protein